MYFKNSLTGFKKTDEYRIASNDKRYFCRLIIQIEVWLYNGFSICNEFNLSNLCVW